MNQSGVVAAELYNFDADTAAFSSALDEARNADAVLANPKAKAELSALLGDTYSGNYKQQSDQIIRTLRNWWLGAYKTYTPKPVRMQVVAWREAHPQNAQLNIDNAAETQYTETNGGVLNGEARNDGNRVDSGMDSGVSVRRGAGSEMSGYRGHGREDQVVFGGAISESLRNAMENSGAVPTKLYDFGSDTAAFSSALDEARNADAVLANPKAKAELSALLGDTYSGNYKQQSDQIIRTLRNWWLGAYKTYSPKPVRMQVVDWREAHPQNAQLNIDNAAETQYTETNGGVLNGLAGSELYGAFGEGVRGSSEGYDRHMSTGWSHGRGNLLHIRERRSVTVSSGGVVTTEVLSPQDSAAFSYYLNTARSEDKRNGWAVTPKTAEELADHEMIMASNGSAGAAVASDGDIQAVFRNVNTGVKGSMEAITPDSVVPELEREIMEGAFSYNPKTNEEVRQTAESWLKEFSSFPQAARARGLTAEQLRKKRGNSGKVSRTTTNDFLVTSRFICAPPNATK